MKNIYIALVFPFAYNPAHSFVTLPHIQVLMKNNNIDRVGLTLGFIEIDQSFTSILQWLKT